MIRARGLRGLLEPFDKYNRATSRGRVAIPIYPKTQWPWSLSRTCGGRWPRKVASTYWMEEGLTGNYYQWFTSKKLKGDVKPFSGLHTLDHQGERGHPEGGQGGAGCVWRYMPFVQEIKDKLKTRSYVYQDLYQKDVNRSLSELGY